MDGDDVAVAEGVAVAVGAGAVGEDVGDGGDAWVGLGDELGLVAGVAAGGGVAPFGRDGFDGDGGAADTVYDGPVGGRLGHIAWSHLCVGLCSGCVVRVWVD